MKMSRTLSYIFNPIDFCVFLSEIFEPRRAKQSRPQLWKERKKHWRKHVKNSLKRFIQSHGHHNEMGQIQDLGPKREDHLCSKRAAGSL
jgi:hypothetical protein